MLVNENNEYGKWGVGEESSLDYISKIEKLVSKREEELNSLKYELVILKDRRLSVYKSNVYYFISEFCHDAMTWHHALKSGTINGEKLDRRKKYDEKDSYEYLINWMKEHLGCDDIEITEFSIYGLGHEAYNIDFNANGHKWELAIPVVKNVAKRSLDEYGSYAFKLKIYDCDEDHVRKLVGSTFKEEELKDLFKEYV